MLVDARIQILIDDTWVDVSAADPIPVLHEGEPVLYEGTTVTFGWTAERLRSQQLQIRRGRADESSRTQPSTVSFTLDNHDGALTPNNPTSPLYGRWQRGVPLRIKAGAGETALVLQGFGAGAALPAPLSLPADFFVAVETRGQSLLKIGQYRQSGNQRGWLVIGNGWRWSPDGATFTDWNPTWPAWVTDPNGRAAIGFHMIPDDGAGGHRVVAYAARRLGDPWEQIDELVAVGTTTVFASSAPLALGDPWGQTPGMFGSVYRAEVRSGGPDGALLASPDFTVAATGATEVTDGQGNVWTVTGEAEVAAAGQVRFFGQVSEITLEWPHGDLEDGDHPGESRVRVTAAGVLRRMMQGSKPLLSALRKAIPEHTPVAYWPLEDAEGAASAASAVPGQPPAPARDTRFAAVEGPLGSDRLPEVRHSIIAAVDRTHITPPATHNPAVAVLYHVGGTPPATAKKVVEGWSTAGQHWTLEMWDGGARFRRENSTGAVLTDSTVGLGPDVWEGWQWVEITSDTTTWQITWWNVGGTAGGWSGSGNIGTPARVTLHGGQGWSFGHLVISDDSGSMAGWLPADGWWGEPSSSRLARLAAEQDLPLTVTEPFPPLPTLLGAQSIGPELDELLKVVAADGGVIREERDRLGLEYRTRSSLYNQAPVLVLDAHESEIANPVVPVDDDQRFRNQVEVRLERGSSAVVRDVESIADVGLYSESVTLNLARDQQAVQHASWMLHRAGWPGMRWPAVTVDLAVAPHLIDQVTAVREGDVIRIVNLPSQHPGPVDLLVEGIVETIGPHQWLVEFTCSPAGPWMVAVAEDPERGRLDTAGCVLAVDVDAEETTWLLDTTVGPEWITTSSHPDEFPFDLEAGGEVVTVTSITGAGTQTATVVRSVNGVRKSHPAGTPVRLAQPAVLAL